MPLPALTTGFWQRFANNEQVDKPVLQILDSRHLNTKDGGPPDHRFRFKISDGQYQYSTCLNQSQLSERIENDRLGGEPGNHPIIRLVAYSGSLMPTGKMSLCLIDYQIVAKTCAVIIGGNPINWSGFSSDLPPLPPTNAGGAQQTTKSSLPNRPAAAPVAAQANFGGNNGSNRPVEQNQGRFQGGGARGGVLAGGGGSMGAQNITPIKMITPYVNKWKICGMVTAKEEIRTIKTARGESRVFNFELTDQSGDEIRVGAWNESADKFFPLINKGQLFYLSNATVKQTNKRFNTTQHDYELSLRSDSEILPCTDREQFAAPRIQFNLVKFDQLEHKVGSIVDVMGVVQMVDEVTHVTSKKNNEELDKRDIHLVDETGTSIRLTLWGEQARSFTTNDQSHPVMALKGVSVREFQGVVLSTMGSTKIDMNPDCTEAHNLSGWYEEQGANMEHKALSMTRDSSTGAAGMRDLRLIGIAEALQLGNRGEEKGVYFNVKAMITNIRTDRALYKACAEPACKKKAIEFDGQYRCEKCNKNSETYKYVMILSAELCDLSGTYWVTLFEESAQKLLGKTAGELGTMSENDPDAYQAVFDNIRFKPFMFRIRSKAETYNDEQKIKWSVYDVRKVSWEPYQDALSKTIEMLQTL